MANDEALQAQDAQGEVSDTHRLRVAAALGDVSGVAALCALRIDLDRVDDGGFTALHHAASAGHDAVVALLLAHGARVDARSEASDAIDGCTALHVAAACGHLRAVGLLLDAGANPAARDECGYTALHLAAELGHKDVVKRLVLAGAPLDALVADETPLGLALRDRRMSVVGLLRQVGART